METTEIAPLKWHTEKRLVRDLIPYEHNPRQMTDRQVEDLTESLRRFGLVEIPAINLDNKLVAGHQRTKIMGLLEMWDEEIDVRVPSRMLTPEEFDEYLIRSNKNTGDWDYDLLQEHFDLDALLEWGFEQAELAEQVKPQVMVDTQGDDEAPEVALRDPLVKAGDLFQLGDHRLLCGSATEEADLELLLAGDAAVELLLTDPPYNVAYVGKTKDALTIANDSMDSSNFYQFLFDFYENAFRHVADGGGVYIFHADTEGANFRSAMTDAGFDLIQNLIWVKQTMVMGRQDYHWKHEPLLFGCRPGGEPRWYSDKKQSSVLRFDRPTRNDVHPTMKPIAILEYLLECSSAIGDLVLDTFGGSGSTLIACQKQARKARITELSPKYTEVIIRRYVTFCRENGVETVVKHLNGALTAEQIMANID